MEDLQMTGKHLLIATAITTALFISAGAYAGGGMGGGQGMMGGQGQGMMGSGGNGMMGSGQIFSGPWTSSQPRRSPTDQYKQQESERLREEIRGKRLELSALYRSEEPNKEKIDQKITELDELEAKLDEKLSKEN
jgi:Spy/CpxP family protein refolding chaperone